MWKSLLALLPATLMLLGTIEAGQANPAPIFAPRLNEIKSGLPQGWEMRLPSRILLSPPADSDLIDRLVVKVFPSKSPAGMTIGLYTCETNHHPCLVGSFSVDSSQSENAQRELKRHQAAAAPIKLGASGARGYLLEGVRGNLLNSFSSVMWEQNGMIYTVRFSAAERQNILFMAYSMANQTPIFSTATATRPFK